MSNNNGNYFNENKNNQQPFVKFHQQNRQSNSKYGSFNSVSANNIVSLIAHDDRCTLVENDISNNSIYNKNNKQSSLQVDRHNIQFSSTSSFLTGNGGVGITSSVASSKMSTTIKYENGTGSNDIKGTYHSFSQTAQHNIEHIASFVAPASTNTVLQHDDGLDSINSNGNPRSISKPA